MTNDDQIARLLMSQETRRKGFEQLVRQYSETLYWQIRRMVLTHDDANDVLQNVFLKAWSNLDSFRNDSKLSTWLYRIATNERIDFLRKKKNKPTSSADDEDCSIAQNLMADEYFDGNETEAMLQEAIAQLPEVQRAVFNMKYFDDMKYTEISAITHTSVGALKASYHFAVKKISEYFQHHD